MTKYRGFKPVTAREAGIQSDKQLNIALDNTPGNIAASNTAAVLTAVIVEDYNLSGWDAAGGIPKHILRLYFNAGVEKIEVDLSKGVLDLSAVTADEIVSALNSDAKFAKYAVATKSTNKPVITTLALGTNAKVKSEDVGANLLIDFPAADAAGSIAASLFQCTVYNGEGELAGGSRVRVQVYDASSAGALLASTYVQRAIKGSFYEGENTNDAVMVVNSDGELDFEVATNISGGDELYIELSPDVTDDTLSTVPARENITKST